MELGYQLWHARAHESGKIMLLHGMGGTGQLWRPIAASLEENFAVLAPDQRGHGRSQIPEIPGARTQARYSPLDYGQDLVELTERLGFHPCLVVGHSMGVRSACALAYLKPQWVKGLILVDLGFSGVAGGGLGEDLAAFLRLLPMRFSSREEARAFMQAHCPDPSIAQYLMAVSIRTAEGGLTFPFDRSALIQTIEAARDASVRSWVEALARQSMRVLVLRGAQSQVWSHEEFEAEKARFAPFPTVQFKEIPGAGHGLPFEQRPLFIQELLAFSKTLRPG